MSALEKICGRPAAPTAAWFHQIHTAGGASGPTTMVMLFVRLSLVVCRQVQKIDLEMGLWMGVTKWPTQACTKPTTRSGVMKEDDRAGDRQQEWAEGWRGGRQTSQLFPSPLQCPPLMTNVANWLD